MKRPQKKAPPAGPAAPPGKRPGRPPGKRSDPNYEQVTAYVRRETYAAVRRKLFLEENEREFSDLVEELLSRYVHRKSH